MIRRKALIQMVYERRMDQIMVEEIENIIQERIIKYIKKYRKRIPQLEDFNNQKNQEYSKNITLRIDNKIVYMVNIFRDEWNYSDMYIFSNLPKNLFRIPKRFK